MVCFTEFLYLCISRDTSYNYWTPPIKSGEGYGMGNLYIPDCTLDYVGIDLYGCKASS